MVVIGHGVNGRFGLRDSSDEYMTSVDGASALPDFKIFLRKLSDRKGSCGSIGNQPPSNIPRFGDPWKMAYFLA
jgi:hypothetical protein